MMKKYFVVGNNVNDEKVMGVTHGGPFHADEVAATVLLRLAFGYDEFYVKRVFKIDDTIDKDHIIVYDIGGGKYDHHIRETMPEPRKESGCPYSSAGLIWKDFKYEIMFNIITEMEASEEEKEFIFHELENSVEDFFDRNIIQPIDAGDNRWGDNFSYITQVVSQFAHIKGFDRGFSEAVEIVDVLLINTFKLFITKFLSFKKIEKAYNDSLNNPEYSSRKILFLEEFVPYEQYIRETGMIDELEFVIHPSARNDGWAASALTYTPGAGDNKKKFPEEWRGLVGENLKFISKIDSAVFCHAAGFMFSAGKLEDVIKAIDQAEAE